MRQGRSAGETAAVNLLICLIVAAAVALLFVGSLAWTQFPAHGSAEERKNWVVGFAVTTGLVVMVAAGVLFCLYDQFGRMLF